MRIRFWGTRGSIPTPGPSTVRYGGNTACVEVRDSAGALLILDAGTGLRELGIAMMNGLPRGPFSVDLLLSHLHWDHIQGIPFFRPVYDPRSTLRIRGPLQSRPLRELLGLGMEDPFFPVDLDGLPVQLEVHDMSPDATVQLGSFHVRSARVHHPAPALAYRIEADGHAIVYATDTEDPFTGHPNPVIALSEGVDALIHDAQYLASDYKPGWGHSTIETAIDVAAAAHAKRLLLYHHDPDRNDEALDRIAATAEALGRERAKGLEVLVAREGMEIVFS